MLFTKNAPLNILLCTTCASTGFLGSRRCPECHSMAMGRFVRGSFFYIGDPLTRYHIRLRRARRWLERFQILGACFFSCGFLALFLWEVSRRRLLPFVVSGEFWFSSSYIQAIFWLSIVFFSYLMYRLMSIHGPKMTVERHDYREGEPQVSEETTQTLETWRQAKNMPRKKRKDIAKTFTDEVKQVLEEAYGSAEKYQNTHVEPIHVFYALLSSQKISSVFIRLGISVSLLKAKIAEGFAKSSVKRECIPLLSFNTQQILFQAYENAYVVRQSYVSVTDLLIATVRQSEELQELLYDLNIDKQKLTNVIEWVRIRERLREQYTRFRKVASHQSKHGIDRAMTAVATPFLNRFSQDITLAAISGYLLPSVAREKDTDSVLRLVESGRQGIVLVGERGVGKITIVEGIAQRMIEDAVPRVLHDKRLVELSTSALVAGTTMSGAQERLIHMMNEIAHAGNIVLCINNLHDLTVSTPGEAGMDVSETLAEFINSARVLVIATSTIDGYNRHILNSQIGKVMARIDIKEMDENQAIQVLESKVGGIEYKHQVFFSYDALESAVGLAKRFLQDQRLPSSAVNLLSEAGSFVRNKKGENQLVGKEDIGRIVEEKTGIPATTITEDESTKLMKLEEALHERVVGQSEAVRMVANALRRARAQIRSTNRPIANFLFLGPTGVGKTELAKTIAAVYFGGEERMVRFDMSEYQDTNGIARLIGQPGQQGTGLLTEAVRQRPFSLVLLDEMEKAEKNILDLFLQVFDDGRLTDSVGRVIDFTNAIIIATSNAGTPFIQEGIRNGIAIEDIQQHLLKTELKQFFRPEFLNRFDGIVVFKPLGKEEVKQIASLMLKRVTKDMEARGVDFRVDESGIDALAEVGFEPEFGARPMRRAIQEMVENKLAEMVLSNKLSRRDVVVFDGQGIRVKRS